jgi:hypothetical protein
MKRYLLMTWIFAVLLFVSAAGAQSVSAEAVESMKQVAVIVGEWEGSSWMLTPQGSREESTVQEKLQWKLDGTMILIEGLGKNREGRTVHNALGLLTYDVRTKQYTMRSYLSDGRITEARFEILGKDTFRWSYPFTQGGRTMWIRYTLTFTDGNRWNEVGEYSANEKDWTKFFEMNLVRTK